MLFTKGDDGLYHGYNVTQIDELIYRNPEDRYPEGRRLDKIEIVNTYNLQIEKGNNKILPAKEKTRELTQTEMKTTQFYKISVRVPKINYSPKRRLS